MPSRSETARAKKAPEADAEPEPDAAAAPRARFTCVAPLPQPSELTCFTCGAFIGHDVRLVRAAMSQQKLDNAKKGGYLLEFSTLMPNEGPVVGDLLDALGYKSHCCRSKLLTTLPHKGSLTA
jgi:DNA-directed RNA polymerase subunit N (RpoN/RPB10)